MYGCHNRVYLFTCAQAEPYLPRYHLPLQLYCNGGAVLYTNTCVTIFFLEWTTGSLSPSICVYICLCVCLRHPLYVVWSGRARICPHAVCVCVCVCARARVCVCVCSQIGVVRGSYYIFSAPPREREREIERDSCSSHPELTFLSMPTPTPCRPVHHPEDILLTMMGLPAGTGSTPGIRLCPSH
jgi:hypothetical protein